MSTKQDDRTTRISEGFEALQFPPEFEDIIKRALQEHRGDLTVCESAIGTLFMAYTIGWRPLYVAHALPTLRRYEKILGVKFKDVVPETTPMSEKLAVWRVVSQARSYWDVVNGRTELTGRQLLE